MRATESSVREQGGSLHGDPDENRLSRMYLADGKQLMRLSKGKGLK